MKLFYVVAVDITIAVKLGIGHCNFILFFNAALCNKRINLITCKCEKLR